MKSTEPPAVGSTEPVPFVRVKPSALTKAPLVEVPSCGFVGVTLPVEVTPHDFEAALNPHVRETFETATGAA